MAVKLPENQPSSYQDEATLEAACNTALAMRKTYAGLRAVMITDHEEGTVSYYTPSETGLNYQFTTTAIKLPS